MRRLGLLIVLLLTVRVMVAPTRVVDAEESDVVLLRFCRTVSRSPVVAANRAAGKAAAAAVLARDFQAPAFSAPARGLVALDRPVLARLLVPLRC